MATTPIDPSSHSARTPAPGGRPAGDGRLVLVTAGMLVPALVAGVAAGSAHRVPALVLVLAAGAALAAIGAGFVALRRATRAVSATSTSVAEDAEVMKAMTDRVEQDRRRLVHQALFDPLTGLPNRALLADRSARALARLAAAGSQAGGAVVLLLVDIDDFRAVNDGLGQAAGDELLRAVGARLQATLEGAGLVARLGGDEFVVLLEDARDEPAGGEAAARILAALEPPIPIFGTSVSARPSIGVAVSATGADTIEDLLSHAENAMYAAKTAGGGCCRLFETQMLAGAEDRLALEADLREALRAGGLRVHYQLIVGLQDGRPWALEALVRWTHPVRGPLPPPSFIPTAERTGLIVPLGRFVLRAACEDLVRLDAAGLVGPGVAVNVNVSPRQLLDEDFVQDVAGTLQATGVAAERLVLEITETMVVSDEAAVQRRLLRLKELGVRIAIDDFGAGYSSLRLVSSVEIDELKIDRRFIADLVDTGSARSRLARAVLLLGEALGVATVAEGVETQQQVHELRELGCELAQGFLFARPVSFGKLVAHLRGAATEPVGLSR
jgi:diguanylate cyclase (GGDEF)-like protein